MGGTISYLNTDVGFASPEELTELAVVCESRGVFALHVARRNDGLCYGSFEPQDRHADQELNIRAMVTVAESLEGSRRAA